MLQDGVGSQGMGAVPRVGSRNHTEMPLGKSLARCLWHSPWAAQVEGGVFSWLRGAACVGAQHGSSGIGSIQGQVGPCPREHLEGGSSQSWQCPVHTVPWPCGMLWVSMVQEVLQQVRIKQGCGFSSWLGTGALWAGVAPADSAAAGGIRSEL